MFTKKTVLPVVVSLASTLGVMLLACNGASAQKIEVLSGSDPIGIALITPGWEERRLQASNLLQEGRRLLKQGKTEEAIQAFRRSLDLYPLRDDAYRHLAEIYVAQGNLNEALTNYRIISYDKRGQSSLLIANDIIDLMNFAIVLSKVGQRDEALLVYSRGLKNLNITDNKPRTEYPAPLTVAFDNKDNQSFYTPARFEAAARTAIGMEEWLVHARPDAALEQLQKAVALQPRLAVAHFYRGLVLKDKRAPRGEVEAAFSLAAQLGRGAVKAAAEKALHK